MDEILGIVFRAAHIVSAIVIVGAAFYMRLVGGGRAPVSYIAVPAAILVATGFWQFVQATGQGVEKYWHMAFGAKFLLALHVVAVMLLAQKENIEHAKRDRLTLGALVSGSAIVVIAVAMATMRLVK